MLVTLRILGLALWLGCMVIDIATKHYIMFFVDSAIFILLIWMWPKPPQSQH